MKINKVYKCILYLIIFGIPLWKVIQILGKSYENINKNTTEKKIEKTKNEIKYEEDSYVNKTIFFTATEQPKNKKLILNSRTACAIESAALNNKDWNIVLVALDVTDLSDGSIYVQTLRNYLNFHIVNTTLYKLTRNSPAETWIASNAWKKTNYLVEHLSDFIRFFLLWKYGGVYLDTDLISFVNYNVLKPNWIAASEYYIINTAALSFASNGFGHALADICLRQFIKHFNTSEYNANGPYLITRVLKFICSTENITEMNRKACINYTVLKPNSFYSVSWKEYQRLFSEQEQDTVVNLYNNAYGIHHWNSVSKKFSGKKGVGALNIFASRHCPKIYAVAEELVF